MFRRYLAEAKYHEIEGLVRQGLKEVEICKIAGVSNTPVRKVKVQLGIIVDKTNRYDLQPRQNPKLEDFVCPGIKGCVICRHQFQHGCPMATNLDA